MNLKSKLIKFSIRFLVNATLGSSLSSPIDSPDIMHTFLPFSDVNSAVASSIKPTMDNSVYKTQQVRSIRITTPFSASSSSSATTSTTAATNYSRFLNNNHSNYTEANTINNNSKSLSAIPETILENSKIISSYNEDFSKSYNEENHCEIRSCFANNSKTFANYNNKKKIVTNNSNSNKLVEFSLSSVGRSFFDEDGCSDGVSTPETPPANLTPSTSSNKFSPSFSTDFINQKSPVNESNENFLYENFGGSWDLLELDLDFHEVNLDPSFGGDLEECMFFGDDPFGLLPCRPTPPDSLDF